MKQVYILICICLLSLNSQAQKKDELQALKDTFLAAFKSKPSLTAYLDGRRSFVNSVQTQVWGGFVGVNYNKRVDLGLGYYRTISPASHDIDINVGTPFQTKGTRMVDFGYLAIKAEYTFYKTKHLEFAVPLQLGIGQASMQDIVGSLRSEKRVTLVPLETGISGTYLVYPWIGVSAGIGYRLNLTHWEYFNEFTAMNYTFGICFRFGTFWTNLKRGPKYWYKGCTKNCCLF